MKTLISSNFSKIINTEIKENSLFFEVLLNPNHEIYRGHFPSRPITPGVCTLQLARELMEIHFQKKLQLIKANNIKFTGMIDPKQTPQITISIQTNPSEILNVLIVKVNVTYQNTVFCKFSGEYSFLPI
jgi:3-hydroxyacyl-[acyl-carrier-protein] dehydratase